MLEKILGVVTKIAPELLKQFGSGGIAAAIPLVVGIVERLIPGEGKGPEKFKAVQLIAQVGIMISEQLSGKDIFDDDKAIESVNKMIEGAVGFYNAFNAWPDIEGLID